MARTWSRVATTSRRQHWKQFALRAWLILSSAKPTLTARRKRQPSLAKTLGKLARKASKMDPSLGLACAGDSAMHPKIARVLGPYRCRDKWRLVVFENEGRKSIVDNSIEQAEKIKADMLRLFEDRSLLTVGAALDEWLQEKRQAGIKELSIQTVDGRLRPFLPLEATLAPENLVPGPLNVAGPQTPQLFAPTRRLRRRPPARGAGEVFHHRELPARLSCAE